MGNDSPHGRDFIARDDAIRNTLGFRANELARIYEGSLTRELAPLGIAPAQFRVLMHLWEEDGITQSSIVKRSRIEQSTIALTLKRMERDGLITRRPDPSDSRAQLIIMTQRARVLRAPATEAIRRANAEGTRALSAAELEALTGLLDRVLENFGAA